MTSSYRLSSADFKKIRPARRLNGTFFTLSLAPHPRGLKWACVVSKKVSPKAVLRNLIKRRCRSVVQKTLSTIHEPLALVFLAKRGAAEASFSELKQDLEALLGRGGLHGTIRRT